VIVSYQSEYKAEPVNMVIVEIYMPSSGHSGEEVDDMYEVIEDLVGKQKDMEHILIMGGLKGWLVRERIV